MAVNNPVFQKLEFRVQIKRVSHLLAVLRIRMQTFNPLFLRLCQAEFNHKRGLEPKIIARIGKKPEMHTCLLPYLLSLKRREKKGKGCSG
jgi:hypothetical protein